MIRCDFFTKKNLIVGYIIDGHAGYAEHGEDIVCSAVSVLAQGIANGISEVIKIESIIEVEDGFLSLSLRRNSIEEIKQCQVLLETLMINIRDLEKNYSDFIKVVVKEEVQGNVKN